MTVSLWETHNCPDFQWKHRAISQAWTANKITLRVEQPGKTALFIEL